MIELVKNSYDADASFVKIKFFPPLVKGQGRIEVSDDGHGMTIDDIRLKWMEPATASKTNNRVSAKKSRPMMGSKGIGRFATAKLGASMSLVSTSDNNNADTVLIPELDWSIFSEDVYLSDIEIDYLTHPKNGNEAGTLIEVRELNETWEKEKLERLYLELRRLVSPLTSKVDEKNKFSIFLDLSECSPKNCGYDATNIVEHDLLTSDDELHLVKPLPLLSSCDYELMGEFDSSGNFKGHFQIKRAGRGPDKVELKFPSENEDSGLGPFSVHFSIFDREAEAIKRNMQQAGMGEMKVAQARKILDSISGVSIYRGGFRVRPYGDAENDWLALDTRRVQNPSMRVGRNQISGFISVADQHNTDLQERSSREGFEDNAAFERLTYLVLQLFVKIVEPARLKFREDAGLSRKKDTTFDETKKLTELSKVKRVLAKLDISLDERNKIEKAISAASSVLVDRIEQLDERQRKLEAQSSLGAIIGEVLHEGSPEARYVADTTNRLSRRLPVLLKKSSDEYEDTKTEFIRKLSHLKDSGERLTNLFNSLAPLSGGKRSAPKFFFPISNVKSAAEIYQKHNVVFEVDNQAKGLEAIGYSEDLSTALINIFGNAVHWLEENKVEDPLVYVTLSRVGEEVKIIIRDNGPGIPTEFHDSIFDVGFSLRENGTGLGLNIAREALSRSAAKLFYDVEYDDGASFEILFPAKRVLK